MLYLRGWKNERNTPSSASKMYQCQPHALFCYRVGPSMHDVYSPSSDSLYEAEESDGGLAVSCCFAITRHETIVWLAVTSWPSFLRFKFLPFCLEGVHPTLPQEPVLQFMAALASEIHFKAIGETSPESFDRHTSRTIGFSGMCCKAP